MTNKTDKKYSILIIDDEESVRESLGIVLEDKYNIIFAEDGIQGLEKYKQEKIDLVLLDIRMPGMNGTVVLSELEKLDPLVDVIMLTATRDIEVVSETIHKGARNYITKPFDIEELLSLIEKILSNKERLSSQLKASEPIDIHPILMMESMATVRFALNQCYTNNKPIIIEGDTGTEKEEVASYIHYKSNRNKFIRIYCIEKTNIDSISGSNYFMKNVGQITSGTTVYFNRIDLLNEQDQKRLLGYFQEMLESQPNAFENIRIISNVKRNLKRLVSAGLFDEELYHYINGQSIVLPALQKREEDLPSIVNYYINYFNKQMAKNVVFDRQIINILCQYDWPGNIAELKNTILSIVCKIESDNVKIKDIPLNILLDTNQTSPLVSFENLSDTFEKIYLEESLRFLGNIENASKKLDVSVTDIETIGS